MQSEAKINDQPDVERAVPAEVAQWVERLDALYQDFPRRIQPEEWTMLFRESVCLDPAYAKDILYEGLFYLKTHPWVPQRVYGTLENQFHILDRQRELENVFPPAYLIQLSARILTPDLFPFSLFSTFEESASTYDSFLDKCSRLMDNWNRSQVDVVKNLLEGLQEEAVSHPVTVLFQQLLDWDPFFADVSHVVPDTDMETIAQDIYQVAVQYPHAEITAVLLAHLQEARGNLEKAASLYHTAGGFWSDLGMLRCMFKTGNYSAVEDAFRRSEVLYPGCRIFAQIRKSGYQMLLDSYLPETEDSPLSVPDALICAKAYLILNQPETGWKLLQEKGIADQEDPGEELLLFIGEYKMALQLSQKAVQIWEGLTTPEIQQKSPQVSARAFYHLANFNMTSGKIPSASWYNQQAGSLPGPDAFLIRLQAARLCYMNYLFEDALELCYALQRMHPASGEICLLKGRIYAAIGQKEKGFDFLEVYSSLTIFTEDSLLAYMDACMETGNLAQADIGLHSWLRQADPDWQTYYQAAYQLKKGRPEQAGDLLKKVIAKKELADEPDLAARTFADMALVCAKKSQYDLGVKYAQRAIQSAKDQRPYFVRMGDVLALFGEIEKADEAYQKAIHLDPRYVPAFYAKAILLIEQKNEPNQAAPLLEEACRIYPQHLKAHRYLGKIYAENKEWEKALIQYRHQSAIAGDFELLLYQGDILGRLGRFREALDMYEEACRQKKDNALAWCQRGQVLMTLGDMDMAISCFRIGMSYYPETSDIPECYYENLATTFARMKKYTRIYQICDEQIREKINPSGALFRKGFYYCLNKRFEDAIHLYREMLQQEPKAPEEIYNRIGQVYFNGLEDEKRAERAWKKAIKVSMDRKPALAESLFQASAPLVWAGKKSVIRRYKKILSVKGDDLRTNLSLGEALVRFNKKEAAEPYLKKAMDQILQEFPDHYFYNKNKTFMARAFMALGEEEKALQCLDEALAHPPCLCCPSEKCYEALYLKGLVLKRQNKGEEAAPLFQEARQLNPLDRRYREPDKEIT